MQWKRRKKQMLSIVNIIHSTGWCVIQRHTQIDQALAFNIVASIIYFDHLQLTFFLPMGVPNIINTITYQIRTHQPIHLCFWSCVCSCLVFLTRQSLSITVWPIRLRMWIDSWSKLILPEDFLPNTSSFVVTFVHPWSCNARWYGLIG